MLLLDEVTVFFIVLGVSIRVIPAVDARRSGVITGLFVEL